MGVCGDVDGPFRVAVTDPAGFVDEGLNVGVFMRVFAPLFPSECMSNCRAHETAGEGGFGVGGEPFVEVFECVAGGLVVVGSTLVLGLFGIS